MLSFVAAISFLHIIPRRATLAGSVKLHVAP